MFKIIVSLFGKMSPMKAYNTVIKIGNHGKLLADTFEFYKSEGVKRGLLEDDTVVIIKPE